MNTPDAELYQHPLISGRPILERLRKRLRRTPLSPPSNFSSLLVALSAKLIEAPESDAPFADFLVSLCKQLGLEYAAIHMMDEDSGKLICMASSDALTTMELEEKVGLQILTQLARSDDNYIDLNWHVQAGQCAAIGLSDNTLQYGFLLFSNAGGGSTRRAPFIELVANLANIISSTRRARIRLREVVYQERVNIARELHDSLAQSLSYLKIQSARLKTNIDKRRDGGAIDHDKLDNALGELRENLNIAYSQLRELMTTFRLTMGGKHLAQAIEESIDEFRNRSRIAFASDIRVSGEELSAQEELQLLQIVREGLANIVRHSRASRATITLKHIENQIQLTIFDNGVGIGDIPDPAQHHGLVIIQERTRRLGGNLFVGESPKGGTRMEIHFKHKGTERG